MSKIVERVRSHLKQSPLLNVERQREDERAELEAHARFRADEGRQLLAESLVLEELDAAAHAHLGARLGAYRRGDGGGEPGKEGEGKHSTEWRHGLVFRDGLRSRTPGLMACSARGHVSCLVCRSSPDAGVPFITR